MKEIVYLILAGLLLAGTCDADLFDLDDYILSTGDITVYSSDDATGFAFRNDTTNEYTALFSFGKENEAVNTLLYESNNSTLNPANFTAEEGFEPVKKPYPGYLKTNSSTDMVVYTGMVNEHLLITMLIGSYQRAIDVLPEIAIISREEYQAMKSDELVNTLN